MSSDSYTIYADGSNGKIRPRSKDRTYLYGDTTLTSSGISFTTAVDGLVIVHANKNTIGYTLHIAVNGIVVDQTSYYAIGGDSAQMELLGFVRKGDSVQIYSDGDYDNYKIQCVIIQSIDWV